jgi:DNA invertase Pin-like site-specific DNA recombinase
MDRRTPRPRQPVDPPELPAAEFDGGQPGVLSWLQSVAVDHQSAPAEAGPVLVPVAFAARVSDKEAQDPTLSLPRQLAKCRSALPDGFVIVAHFYDIESGRMDLDLRGHGGAHAEFDIPIPRDGAITDLLEEAHRPDRRFVAVVCESVDRIARITYFGTKIEYELEQAGVALLVADEGITADAVGGTNGRLPRKRATPVLTRRVKQAIAEWYVLDMLERSWGGLVAHTDQGWNIGKPPYGYQAEVHKHPVPAKAADGKVKRRLIIDPDRGPVVTQIFAWRASGHWSYEQIATQLNTDLDHYPPPQPIPGRGRRAIGRWTGGAVREILCNPKYTGYMVYNRRKRSRPERQVAGQVNPPAEWVWSTRPTHEPLTTRQLFDAGTPIGRANRGSRPGAAANRHPQTQQVYPLRSYVICELCGRRMHGKTRRIVQGEPYRYYACETDPAHHAHQDWYATHPKSLWVREDQLLDAVNAFFARRIFGAYRRDLLAQQIAAEPKRDDAAAAQRIALTKAIKEIQRQQTNVITELRSYQTTGDDQIDQQWRDQLRASFADLATQAKTAQARLDDISQQAATPGNGDTAILDHLPVLDVNVANLPDELQRELFDAFRLQIRYHQPTRRVTLRVTINGDIIDRLLAVLSVEPTGIEKGATASPLTVMSTVALQETPRSVPAA